MWFRGSKLGVFIHEVDYASVWGDKNSFKEQRAGFKEGEQKQEAFQMILSTMTKTIIIE